MMRTIKTSRGNVFVTAWEEECKRLQKNGKWAIVKVISVAIHAACSQPATNPDGDKVDYVDDFPGDVLGRGSAFRSEVETKDDPERALKLAFGRAVGDFSANVNDRRALWKAFRKGL